jgi:hypothetical protein
MEERAIGVQLRLSEPDSDAGELQKLTRELARSLNCRDAITASVPEDTPAPGKKGAFQEAATLLLQLAGSGGAVALVGVLKSWFERRPLLDIEVQRADGAKLKLHAENVGSKKIEQLRIELEGFLRG